MAAITFSSALRKLFFLAMVRLFSLAGFLADEPDLADEESFLDELPFLEVLPALPESVFFLLFVFFCPAKAPPYEPVLYVASCAV